MKKGFTLIEGSILFVIFLIVAFLVAPLSLDDTLQAKNTSRWRGVQSDFANIFYSINTEEEQGNSNFKDSFNSVISNEIKGEAEPYKIVFLNGTYPNITYRFKDFKLTQMNSVLSVKMFDKPQNGMMLTVLQAPIYGVKMSLALIYMLIALNLFVKSRLSVFRNKIVPKMAQASAVQIII